MRDSASGSVVEGEGVGHMCPNDSCAVEMLNQTVWAWVSWGVSSGGGVGSVGLAFGSG